MANFNFYEQLCAVSSSRVIRQASRVSLAAGQTLYGAGDRPEAVYFPHGCLLVLGIGSAAGDMTGISLIGAEGMAGGLEAAASVPSYVSCTVQVAGEAYRLPAGMFAEVIEADPPARRLVERLASVWLAEAQQWSACSVLHDTESRYAEKLVKAAERTGDLESVRITQSSLAMLLGVQRTTITHIANSLQDRGVIRSGRGRVDIRDLGALRHLACSCRGDLATYHAVVMGDDEAGDRAGVLP